MNRWHSAQNARGDGLLRFRISNKTNNAIHRKDPLNSLSLLPPLTVRTAVCCWTWLLREEQELRRGHGTWCSFWKRLYVRHLPTKPTPDIEHLMWWSRSIHLFFFVCPERPSHRFAVAHKKTHAQFSCPRRTSGFCFLQQELCS